MRKNLDIPFSKRVIQQLANKIICRHATLDGWKPSLPIPVEDIADRTLDLHIEWDEISENDGKVWGMLLPNSRLIRLNKTYLQTFEDCPGLERFTLAHEVRHWEMHVDKAEVGQQTLFDVSGEEIICRDGDDRPCEVSANMFASFLLMPAELMKELLSDADLRFQKGFRDFAERIGVSRIALHYRLDALGVQHFWS